MQLIINKISVINKILIPFIIALCLASCSSTSTFVGVNNNALNGANGTTINFEKQKIAFINSYISNIDQKATNPENFDISQLEILGNERIITTNESKKDIVLKNQSIVRVQYKDHLYNNFIKSKVFYYDQDELVCIKIIEVLPDSFNKVGVYKRTIYIHDNLPISDSDLSKVADNSLDLVSMGQEYLINEYSSLN